MLVEDLQHGQFIADRWMARNIKWLVLDTETQARPPYQGVGHEKDALVIGRAEVIAWSLCYRGEAYGFLTNLSEPSAPSFDEWMAVFRPLIMDPKIPLVAHNLNYDYHVLTISEAEFSHIPNVYCTMVGCWLANEDVEKGLKSRAPLYGRHLLETRTVDFDDSADLGEYAEQDVVVADEIFQMQQLGCITRKKWIKHLTRAGKLVSMRNHYFFPPTDTGLSYTFKVPEEELSGHERVFLRRQELPYLRCVFDAERVGFPFRRKLLLKIRKELLKAKEDSLKLVYREFGSVVNLNSPKQLAEALGKLGIQSPVKTKSGAQSFKESALAQMLNIHPVIGHIQSVRSVGKLESVYVGNDLPMGTKGAKRGLEHFISPKGRIHATANSVGAVTGRGSSSNPNLQQIPSRKDIFGIKKCFIPPKGRHLICFDYAQLEIRVMAMYCDDPAMVTLLCDPTADIHQNTADQFGVARNPTAKNLNFLMLYGGGAHMLSGKLTEEGVPTSRGVAKQYIDAYDNRVYPGVKRFREFLLRHHRQHGYVSLLTRRRRTIHDIDWGDKWAIHKAETTLSNNVVQGGGQDFLKAAVIRLDPCRANPDIAMLKKYQDRSYLKAADIDPKSDLLQEHLERLNSYAKVLPAMRKVLTKSNAEYCLQVHDELVYFADKAVASDVAEIIGEVMSWQHFFCPLKQFSVPLIAEGGIGASWGEAKSKTPIKSFISGWESKFL